MLIAVAGASGKLGRAFLLYCKKHKLASFALVRSKEAAKKIPAGIACRQADYSDADMLRTQLADATHIVNITGSADTRLGANALMEANTAPTKALLDASPPKLARFVHISSISVYGKKFDGILDENSQKNADTAYAKSKLEGENITLSYSGKLPVVILRPGMIYGPGFREGYFAVLKKIKNNNMQILGNGQNHLPLVHSDDVADAIYRALVSKPARGQHYILVAQPQLTQNELLSLAAKLLGTKEPSKHTNPAIASASLCAYNAICPIFGKRPSLTCDMLCQLYSDRQFSSKKALRELGWQASISFKSGIEQVIKEYLASR